MIYDKEKETFCYLKGTIMNREHQYYKLNRIFKKSYHARIRAGEEAGIFETYREMNEAIVALFHHTGLIGTAAAEALGHHHDHAHEAQEDADAAEAKA